MLPTTWVQSTDWRRFVRQVELQSSDWRRSFRQVVFKSSDWKRSVRKVVLQSSDWRRSFRQVVFKSSDWKRSVRLNTLHFSGSDYKILNAILDEISLLEPCTGSAVFFDALDFGDIGYAKFRATLKAGGFA